MEWKIVLKHKENPWVIEIIGIGEDPHKPVELIIKSNTGLIQVKKVIEELKFKVEHPPAFLPSDIMQSGNDMYLWESIAYTYAAVNGWTIESNLPELKIEEGEEVRKLREEGITPIF
jgi:hypothetical protein